MNSPIKHKTIEVDLPMKQEATAVDLTNKLEIVKMDIPNKQKTAELNLPNKQETPGLDSQNEQEFAELDSPNKQETTEMDSPSKKEITDMNSPNTLETAQLDSPNKQEAVEVDSPNKPETTEVDSSIKPETAEMYSPPMFKSIDYECGYWKMRKMKIEMEATLGMKQLVIDDLTFKLTMVERENEALKLQLDSQAIKILDIENLLETVKTQRDMKSVVLSQLEQKIDDQEQEHRILNNGIENFEKILDQAYKLDVDEKGVVQEKLERLMDETRDLKQSLHAKTRSLNSSMNPSTLLPNGIVANGELEDHDTMVAINGSLVNRNEYNHQHLLRNPVKIPTLNYITEMLKDLNNMEAKLKTYQEKRPMPQQRRSSEDKPFLLWEAN